MRNPRLIDANATKKEFMDYAKKLHNKGNCAAGYVMFAASLLDNLPTIEAKHVPRGYFRKAKLLNG